MVTETIDPTTIAYLVDKFGFPIGMAIAAFGVIISILMLLLRSQIKRQEQFDQQYFKNINNILDKYDKSLKEIRDELVCAVVEIRTILTKIDTCRNRLDKQSEAKNVTYIFRNGKIDKIKNIIEEIEVTKDIERKAQGKLLDNR
jgi:RNase P subunit RPR2